MTEFETQLGKFSEESAELQKRQAGLGADLKIFNEKFYSFLIENGLPENFTLPEYGSLVARKLRG